MKRMLLLWTVTNIALSAHNNTLMPVDILFVMASSALVLLMTPALGMFYGGMVNRQNVLSTTLNGLILYAIIALQWITIGFTLAFGNDISLLIGDFNHLFFAETNGAHGGIPKELFAVFQMLFAVIGAAIITGSVVERMRFEVILIIKL